MTKTRRRWPAECPRMTDDQLREFVDEWLAGRIVTNQSLSGDERLLRLVFMPLALGGMAGAPKGYCDSIGLIWENVNEARGGRAVNGFPMFVSCHLMHKADLEIVSATIEAERERRGTTPLVKP